MTKNVAYAMCCDRCDVSDVENDAMLRCQMWWCDVKSRCGGVRNVMWNMVRCEMCCDVECGCGVEQLWVLNGARCGMLCFEMWWC